MDPVLAQAIATLIGAITTVILWAGAYYFGPGKSDARATKKRRKRSDDGDE